MIKIHPVSQSQGLARRLGIQCRNLFQKRRRSDGVRGLFTGARRRCGDDLLLIPYSSCFAAEKLTSNRRQRAPQTEQLQTSSALYPVIAEWEKRFFASQRSRSSRGEEGYDDDGDSCDDAPSVQLEHSLSTENETIHVRLQPFEAALAVAAANRYFFCEVSKLRNHVEWYDPLLRRPTQRRLPISSTCAEARYLQSLATDTLLTHGTEAPHFVSSLAGDSAQDLHSAIEILADSLKDYFMSWIASDNDRRLIEGDEEMYQQVMIAALYAVRSRVLQVERIPSPPAVGEKRTRASSAAPSKEVRLIAPLLDMMNHGTSASMVNCAAIAVDGEQMVKVRATRPLLRGEELLISYIDPSCRGSQNTLCLEQADTRYFGALNRSPEEEVLRKETLAWESRYLFARS